jgi:transcriptional regulator with XRE-family HTH domain
MMWDMPTAAETIGARLRAARLDKGQTVNDLAEHLKVARMTVYRWESGEVAAPVSRWDDIAEVLGANWADA